MAKIKVETIAHNSDAYWEALLLRDRLLRAPLGLDYSEEDTAAEASDVHIVAVESEHSKPSGLTLGDLLRSEGIPCR